MAIEQWVKEARAVAQSHETEYQIDGDPDRLVARVVQELIAQIDALIRSAPQELLTAFRNWGEERLQRGIASKLYAIGAGRLEWNDPERTSGEEWLRVAIEQIRALDQHLGLSSDLGNGPHASSESWRVFKYNVYIIPCSGSRLDGTSPKAGEPYSRRGLIFHRILPITINGLNVRPMPFPVAPLRTGQLVLGAALFEGVGLKTRAITPTCDQPKGFLATAFEVNGLPTVLNDQVDSAFKDGCFAVVWPELTMPPERRLQMVGCLRSAALTGC